MDNLTCYLTCLLGKETSLFQVLFLKLFENPKGCISFRYCVDLGQRNVHWPLTRLLQSSKALPGWNIIKLGCEAIFGIISYHTVATVMLINVLFILSWAFRRDNQLATRVTKSNQTSLTCLTSYVKEERETAASFHGGLAEVENHFLVCDVSFFLFVPQDK